MRKRSQGYHARSFEEYFQKVDQNDTEQEKLKIRKMQFSQRSKSDNNMNFIQTIDEYILESSPNQNIEDFISTRNQISAEDTNLNEQSSSEEEAEEQAEITKKPAIKLKLMIIGSEKVGKSVLIEQLFKDAEDSDSPVKPPKKIATTNNNNSGNENEDDDLSVQSPSLIKMQSTLVQGEAQSLDFIIKRVQNQNHQRMESYHTWIQNLSNDKNIEIVESCYYGSCDIFIFLYSYQVKDSLLSIKKCYEKVKSIRQKRLYSILVGMGINDDPDMHNQAMLFADNCTFFISIDDKANDPE